MRCIFERLLVDREAHCLSLVVQCDGVDRYGGVVLAEAEETAGADDHILDFAAIDVKQDVLDAAQAPQAIFSAGGSTTAALAVVNWNQLLVYPATTPPEQLTVIPHLQLPSGWQFRSKRLA